MESVTGYFAHAELTAVLVAVTGDQPRVMTLRKGEVLPSGPFEMGHRTLQSGLREWVREKTAYPIGYLEQLYTFADRDRGAGAHGGRRISISYLGLVRERSAPAEAQTVWHGWYEYFPWEDRRLGRPAQIADICSKLEVWAAANSGHVDELLRRIALTFGTGGNRWNEDLVLQRYELLYEAGLLAESGNTGETGLGRPMFADHRRILATGIARLRAQIKYRPVVFELMPESFTLLRLQRTVEALAGLTLHKPNFRRLIEQQDLVEETGETESENAGRPAKLFRFRHAILEERALSGSKLPISRN
ncbi:MAG: hypothetical protein JWM58_3150 [Rhizobium sp.]|nr:hypothetical protein [Rhizobium sp.]